MKKTLAAALLGLATLTSCASPQAAGLAGDKPLQTIAALDVPRYMGTWYEIARYPNWFQQKCVANASARYRLQTDGTVAVDNRCRLANGEISSASGSARQIGGAGSPKLQVRFAPAWLSWLPWVWGDYWVIDLDEDYQLVAISEPKRDYLWVLARSRSVAPEDYAALLARLRQQGFDTGRLQRTPQLD